MAWFSVNKEVSKCNFYIITSSYGRILDFLVTGGLERGADVPISPLIERYEYSVAKDANEDDHYQPSVHTVGHTETRNV